MTIVVEPRPDEIQPADGRPQWDLTRRVQELLHGSPAPAQMLLVLAARNCHGCDVLHAQLEAHDEALAGAPVLKAVGGDFLAGTFVRDVVLGRLTLRTPGVPLGVLFDVAAPDRLAFRSLVLGPLPEPEPRQALAELRAGTSHWVEEASGARIQACVGGLCFFLDASNRFSAPFAAILPEVQAA